MPKGIYKHKPFTEEHKVKLSESNKGKHFIKHTEETKLKIKQKRALQGNPTLGKHWKLSPEVLEKRKGRKWNESQRLKIPESLRGEKNWKWILDRTKLKRYLGSKERGSPAYHYWRKQVWTRDNWKCKIENESCNGRIEAHHILSWKDYPELRYNINNGITLCHAHHPRKRAEEKRLSPYFMELVSVSKEKF